MATLRSASLSFRHPPRQTLLIEREMAGMLVLLPDEQILASHEREDGRIELTVGPRRRRRTSSWSWVGFAAAGTALGFFIAELVQALVS
jgi:hypothetical protein